MCSIDPSMRLILGVTFKCNLS